MYTYISMYVHTHLSQTFRRREYTGTVLFFWFFFWHFCISDFSPTGKSAKVWRPPTPWEPNKRPAKCWVWYSSRSCCAGRRSFCWTSCSPCARKPTVRCPTTWPRCACGWATCRPRSTPSSTRYSTRHSGPRSSGNTGRVLALPPSELISIPYGLTEFLYRETQHGRVETDPSVDAHCSRTFGLSRPMSSDQPPFKRHYVLIRTNTVCSGKRKL